MPRENISRQRILSCKAIIKGHTKKKGKKKDDRFSIAHLHVMSSFCNVTCGGLLTLLQLLPVEDLTEV